MSRLDRLVDRYAEHIATPWPEGLSGSERVIFVVYPPAEELRFRLTIDEFELRTREAGHGWRLLALTDSFPRWMSAHRYRDKYFRRPTLLAGYADGRLNEFTTHLVAQTRAQVAQGEIDGAVPRGPHRHPNPGRPWQSALLQVPAGTGQHGVAPRSQSGEGGHQAPGDRAHRRACR